MEKGKKETSIPNKVTDEKKTLDLTEEIRPIDAGETDEELILANDLVSVLMRAVKAFRFYPPDNPIFKDFQSQLFKKFQLYFTKYPALVLQIGEYDISCKGKVLYESRNLKTSIAFIFYKDGLRELRFMKGVEEWEIQGLLDVIKRSNDINQLDDDLVTLMWEKDFIHISYLATDEFLEDNPIVIPENVDQFRKNLVFKPLAYNVEVDQVENQPASGKEWEEILFTKTMETLPGIMNKELYLLTPEEVEKLREEVAGEIGPTFIFNIIDIFFEILAIEKEPEPYQDAATVLDKVLDALLTLGEFQKARELLNRVHFISQTHTLKNWQTEIIQQLILKAGGAKRIERIGNILEKEEKVRLEDVHDYLLLLEQNAIEPLVNVLGRLENLKTRKLLCDILCELGKNTVESFFPFIDDRRWYLVRNIIYILGRLGREEAVPHIQKALKREDVRVRKEVIQALGLIGGVKAGELLVHALSDEDGRIRSMAALNLAKVTKHASLPHLLGIVQSKDFRKRDPSEIKAFFDAIGMVGSNEVIPVLQQLMGKKSWLGLGRIDKIHNGAANALAKIGTPEAKAVLKSDKSAGLGENQSV